MDFYFSRYIAIVIIILAYLEVNNIARDGWITFGVVLVAFLLSIKKPW